MALATLLSRILGLIREQVMAYSFGVSGYTDAFIVAFRIPVLLRDLFAEGAFSSAFVPVFLETKAQRGDGEALDLFGKVATALAIITGGISLVIFFKAGGFVQLLAPSFSENPEKYALTISLVQMTAPFLFFVSLASLQMGVLNSYKVFFIPALAPSAFNAVMILCMIFLPGYLISRGLHPIFSLGYGVFFGGLVKILLQIPVLMQKKLLARPSLALKDERITKIVKLLGASVVGHATNQANIIVTTSLATGTLSGAISLMEYAYRLFQFPIGVFGVSLANSNLVHFGEAWKNGREKEAKAFLYQTVKFTWVLMLPSALFLFWIAPDIVELIFERGAFTKKDTQMCAQVLRFYCVGLPFFGITKILIPSLYTLDRQKKAVMSSMLVVAFNIVFCTLLTPYYGFFVLVWGFVLSMILHALLLMGITRQTLALEWRFYFNKTVVPIIGVALLLCLILTRGGRYLDHLAPALRILVVFLFMASSFLATLYATGDLHFFIRKLSLKIKKMKK